MTLCALFCHSNSSDHHIRPSYHFSSYVAYFPSIVGALRYSSSFSVQQRSVTKKHENGWKYAPSVINNVGHNHFHVLCDGPLLDGKTTAISERWKCNFPTLSVGNYDRPTDPSADGYEGSWGNSQGWKRAWEHIL